MIRDLGVKASVKSSNATGVTGVKRKFDKVEVSFDAQNPKVAHRIKISFSLPEQSWLILNSMVDYASAVSSQNLMQIEFNEERYEEIQFLIKHKDSLLDTTMPVQNKIKWYRILEGLCPNEAYKNQLISELPLLIDKVVSRISEFGSDEVLTQEMISNINLILADDTFRQAIVKNITLKDLNDYPIEGCVVLPCPYYEGYYTLKPWYISDSGIEINDQESINLSECDLKNVNIDSLYKFKNLDLNHSTNIAPEFLNKLLASKYLKEIVLSGCDLSGANPDTIGPNIEKIIPNYTTNIAPEFLNKLLASKSIKEIALDECDLSGVNPANIDPNIETIYLGSSKNIALDFLNKLLASQFIKYIDLNDCDLTSVNPDTIGPSIENINLMGSRNIEPAFLNKLRARKLI